MQGDVLWLIRFWDCYLIKEIYVDFLVVHSRYKQFHLLAHPHQQSIDDLFNKVKQMEDKGFLGTGIGAQEPTTMEEMLEFMNTDAYRRAFS